MHNPDPADRLSHLGNTSDEQFLYSLLLQPPTAPVPPTDDQLLATLLARPPIGPTRKQQPHWLRNTLLVVGLLLLLGLLGLFGQTAYTLLTIHQNIQAMQLPTTIAITPPPPTILPSTTTPASAVQVASVADISPTASNRLQNAATTATSTATPTLTPTLTPLPLETLPSPEMLPSIVPPTTDTPTATPPPTPDYTAIDNFGETIPAPANGSITLLLLGIDQRPGETFAARTDAIAIAYIEPQRRRIAILSLPRDLIVEIPGYGYDRINNANVYGGIATTRQTISNLLDIPINYVMYVNFQGFIGAIDAVGGVTVNVEQELYDARYPTMDYGYMVVHFLPGPQHMDGTTALIYSRVRHMDSDFQRMRRQQALMVAVLEQLRGQNALEQMQSVAAITTALRDYVRTDMSLDRMVELAWELHDLSPESVERYVLDGSLVYQGTDPEDVFALYAQPGAVESLVRQLIAGPTPGQAQTTQPTSAPPTALPTQLQESAAN